jgi:hypothetical protein
VERASKLLVLASLCGALALTAYVGQVMRPGLVMTFAATFAAGFLAASAWSGALGALLASAYLAPAAIAAISGGRYPIEYQTIWTAAVVGAIFGANGTGSWNLPPRWRVPLVGWALVVAVTWPLVVARETDFNIAQLTSVALPSSSYGLRTPTTVLLILEASITLLVSIVWLDWLFAAFARGPDRAFERRVLEPVLVGGAAASAIAVYQLFGDIKFLNPDFSSFGRASGTLMDANAYGAIAAVCAGAIAAWAVTPQAAKGAATTDGGRRRISRRAVAPAGIALMLAGVWASGSKTSLVAVIIVLAFVGHAWFRAGHGAASHRRRGAVAIGVGAGAVALLIVMSALRPQTVLGATQRLWWIVPAPSGPSIRQTLHSMWDRDGYGAAAARMFRQTPIFGVGIGSFPILTSDYGQSRFGGPLLPDNAQNWIRHQLTELGILGSLGWLGWGCAFGWFMATMKPPPEHRARTAIIRGILVAIAIVSLVGMPTQNAALALTLWTLVFWYAVPVPAHPEPVGSKTPQPASVSWKYWAIAALLIAVYAGGTWRLATTTLRVPMRARQFGWPYDYGFNLTEPDGRGGQYRWAQRRAVAVVPASSPIVKLTLWSNRHDIGVNPVRARAWHDDRLVLDRVLRDINPVTTYLVIRDPPPWFMLTTEVDRAIMPKRLGGHDDRESELAVEWSFLDALPSGADVTAWAATRF